MENYPAFSGVIDQAGEVGALRELVGVLREQLEARTREVAELHTLLRESQGKRVLTAGNASESAQERQERVVWDGALSDALATSPVAPRKPWWRFW